jgi:LysM repeat protein
MSVPQKELLTIVSEKNFKEEKDREEAGTMTNWSIPVVRAVRSVLILLVLVVLSFPATAWVQEQSTGTAATSQPAAGQPQNGQAAPAPASPEQSGKYMIRQGDTLWDIANAHYRDPFLWPLIWKSNPTVNDPDLIYPGNALVIPSLAPVERAMSAPEEAAPVQEKAVAEKQPAAPQEETGTSSIFQRRTAIEGATPQPEKPATGSRFVIPEDAPVPIIDKYAMISAGFVSEEDSKDHIQGSPSDPYKGIHGANILGYDDEVYIVVNSRETVNIGDRFLIYQPMHDVRHPETGRDFGTLYKVNGILKVTGAKEANVYTARITLSFDSAIKGNMLAPYQEPTLIYPDKQKKEKNLSGQILEVTDRRSISGQADIVYLDKGKEDGVDPGDRFTVMGAPNRETGVTRPIGELQVLIVKARTSTAVVQKSIDSMAKGNRVVYKN